MPGGYPSRSTRVCAKTLTEKVDNKQPSNTTCRINEGVISASKPHPFARSISGIAILNSKPYFTLVPVEWKYAVHTFPSSGYSWT